MGELSSVYIVAEHLRPLLTRLSSQPLDDGCARDLVRPHHLTGLSSCFCGARLARSRTPGPGVGVSTGVCSLELRFPCTPRYLRVMNAQPRRLSSTPRFTGKRARDGLRVVDLFLFQDSRPDSASSWLDCPTESWDDARLFRISSFRRKLHPTSPSRTFMTPSAPVFIYLSTHIYTCTPGEGHPPLIARARRARASPPRRRSPPSRDRPPTHVSRGSTP